jgi:hypothetical protein
LLRYHQAFELLHNWQRCGYFNDLQHAHTTDTTDSGNSSSSSSSAVFANCETAESKMKAYQELMRVRQVSIVHYYFFNYQMLTSSDSNIVYMHALTCMQPLSMCSTASVMLRTVISLRSEHHN